MCYERKSALGIHRTHILNKDKIDFSKDATGIWICQVERLQLWRLDILIVNYSKQLETYLSSTGTSFSTLLLQQGERRSFSPLSNYSTNEKWLKLSQWKATTLWISIFSNGICLQQLLWTPPFLHKKPILSFVLWTCISPHVPNCNFLLFWINPFCWRNIWPLV